MLLNTYITLKKKKIHATGPYLNNTRKQKPHDNQKRIEAKMYISVSIYSQSTSYWVHWLHVILKL